MQDFSYADDKKFSSSRKGKWRLDESEETFAKRGGPRRSLPDEDAAHADRDKAEVAKADQEQAR